MPLGQKLNVLLGESSSNSVLNNYGASKMADMLIAFKLHRDEYPNGISTYSVHPGNAVRTNIFRNSTSGKILSFLSTPFTKNSSQGAATTVYCASHPEVADVSGRYWESCWDDEKSLDKEIARDEQLQNELWKRLEELDERVCGPRTPL